MTVIFFFIKLSTENLKITSLKCLMLKFEPLNPVSQSPLTRLQGDHPEMDNPPLQPNYFEIYFLTTDNISESHD